MHFFLIISAHWHCAGSWNTSSEKTETHWFILHTQHNDSWCTGWGVCYEMKVHKRYSDFCLALFLLIPGTGTKDDCYESIPMELGYTNKLVDVPITLYINRACDMVTIAQTAILVPYTFNSLAHGRCEQNFR